MRWEGLFADLEGQLAAEQRRERRRRGGRAHPPRARARHARRPARGRVGRRCGSRSSAVGRSTATCTTSARTGCSARSHRRARGAVPPAAVVTVGALGPQSASAARPAGSASATPCGRCPATAPPWPCRSWAEGPAARDHRRRRRRPPRPRRARRGGAPAPGERPGRGDRALRRARGGGVTALTAGQPFAAGGLVVGGPRRTGS